VIKLGNTLIASKDEAAVRYTLLSCLDEFDEEEIEGMKSKGAWDYLWKKYSRTRPVADRANLRELHSFQLGTLSIDDAWIKLKELRRRVVTADSTQKASLTEEALFSLLLEALPPSYETVVDSLDSSIQAIENKLDILRSKADRLNKTEKGKLEDTETGMYSRGKKGDRRKRCDSEDSSGDERPLCYKCDEIGHISTACPYRKAIRRLVRKLQEEGTEGKGKKRGHSKARKEAAAAALASSSESSCDEYGLLVRELITS